MLFWPAPFLTSCPTQTRPDFSAARTRIPTVLFSCFEIRSDGRTWDNIIKAPSGYIFASIYPQTNNGWPMCIGLLRTIIFYRNFVFTPADSDINGNLTGMLWYCNYDYFYTGLGLAGAVRLSISAASRRRDNNSIVAGNKSGTVVMFLSLYTAFDGNFETNDVYYDMADIGITTPLAPTETKSFLRWSIAPPGTTLACRSS